MNQQDMIQLAKAGDKEALLNLLKDVEISIYKTAFYYMGNEHDAKDATQEALIKVYTKLDTYQEKAKFSTWVQRITTNVCMDKFRSSKNELSIDATELNIVEKSNIEKQIEDKIVIEELVVLIKKLPEKLKTVMILRYLHDFSYQEIADTLDLPINTVKSHIFRGRDQLLKEFQQGGVH